MQIQTRSVGNLTPVGAAVDSAARQNAGASAPPPSTIDAGAQTAKLQSDVVAVSAVLEKQGTVAQEDVDQAVQKINETMQTFSQKLEFSVDKETEAFVVKVVDKETKEVIRQIPSEELLNIAKALDKLQGLFIKDQA